MPNELNELNASTPRSSNRLRTLGLIALSLIAGAGAVLILRPDGGMGHATCGMKQVSTSGGAPNPSAPVVNNSALFYRSPMNSAITSPIPMKDEMGMDYVPVYERDLNGEGPAAQDHTTVTRPAPSTAKSDTARAQGGSGASSNPM